jgi:ArsR family transcriptional regulator
MTAFAASYSRSKLRGIQPAEIENRLCIAYHMPTIAYKERFVEQWSDLFRVLANEDRLRIFCLIIHSGQRLCVCEIVDAIGLPQYQVSKHLRLLREAELIRGEHQGRWTYYSLAPGERVEGVARFLGRAIAPDAFTAELAVLKQRLALRQDGRCVYSPQEKKDRQGGAR